LAGAREGTIVEIEFMTPSGKQKRQKRKNHIAVEKSHTAVGKIAKKSQQNYL
jgi:hypothetical protein